MRSLAILSFLLVPACSTSPGNATLANLPSVKIGVQTWEASDAAPTKGFVAVSYDEKSFRAAHGNQCAELAQLAGTVNGVALTDAGLGGNSDEGNECYTPMVNFATTFDGPTTFTLTDGNSTITAAFDATAFAVHVPTLVAPRDWTFHPGQAVRIAWPAPDELPATFEPNGASYVVLSTGKTENNNTMELQPRVVGDEIQFTVPSPLLFTGTDFLAFNLSYSNGNATTCIGAAECTFSSARGYAKRVTLAN